MMDLCIIWQKINLVFTFTDNLIINKCKSSIESNLFLSYTPVVNFCTDFFDIYGHSLSFIFTVVSQYYLSEAENEYVIRGNSVILKCKIPSFVADFVTVEAWLDEEGNEFNNTVNGDIS